MSRPFDFTWDHRFLLWAKVVATASKDPSTKVGAVIVRPDRTVASWGYNGLPRGVLDSHERLTNRDLKYPMTVHAEANAIMAAKEPLAGYTLYCTHPPCASCAGLIIQSGIKTVITVKPSDEMIARWGNSFVLMRQMFVEGGVDFFPINPRDLDIRAVRDGLSFPDPQPSYLGEPA